MKNIYFCSRTSHEVRGLKYDVFHAVDNDYCRTSHEVRGLKFNFRTHGCHYGLSHLTRGAWIEIQDLRAQKRSMLVAPHTRCVD